MSLSANAQLLSASMQDLRDGNIGPAATEKEHSNNAIKTNLFNLPPCL
ncbi:hypothetical protein EMIT0347P_30229 [Pseudomonas sp. IT-347P]